MQKDDVIYRQAAIDIVEFECGEWTGLAETITDSFKQLPSAEPEPCGDMISREYLKEHIEACWINGRPRHAPELNELLSWVDDVPSVQQERKMGKWIKHNGFDMEVLECSQCKCFFVHDHLTRNSYCPNCGSRNEVEDD